MTRLFLAGDLLTGAGEDRNRLLAWQEALVRSDVLSPGERLEPADGLSDAHDGRLIIVVREQLDHINSLYCRAVLALETFDGFDSFVDTALASGRHELAEDMAPVADAANTDVVAVPYSRAHPEEATPGPVLITAARLLSKRLNRARLGRDKDPDFDQRVVESLREKASAHEWDDTTFWGWSRERTADAIEHFEPGNADFAGRWGRDSLDVPTLREPTLLDLAGCRPAVVSDVLTTMQQALDNLE